MYDHVSHVSNAYRGQKKTSDALELELPMDMSHHVSARN